MASGEKHAVCLKHKRNVHPINQNHRLSLQTVHDRSHVLFGHGSKKEGVDQTVPFCRLDLFRQLVVCLIVN